MPHLTLGQVYAALAYYHQHKEEVEQQLPGCLAAVQREPLPVLTHGTRESAVAIR